MNPLSRMISNLDRIIYLLDKVREYQETRILYGVDHIYLYVEDMEGDWLEEWGD